MVVVQMLVGLYDRAIMFSVVISAGLEDFYSDLQVRNVLCCYWALVRRKWWLGANFLCRRAESLQTLFDVQSHVCTQFGQTAHTQVTNKKNIWYIAHCPRVPYSNGEMHIYMYMCVYVHAPTVLYGRTWTILT